MVFIKKHKYNQLKNLYFYKLFQVTPSLTNIEKNQKPNLNKKSKNTGAIVLRINSTFN